MERGKEGEATDKESLQDTEEERGEKEADISEQIPGAADLTRFF